MIIRSKLKKSIVTSLVICIILLIYLMPSVIKFNNINTNFKYIDQDIIYFYDKNNLLVEVGSLNESNDFYDRVNSIFDKLKGNNIYIPSNLESIVPNDINIEDIFIDDYILNIKLSKNILDLSKDSIKKIIDSFSFSLLKTNLVSGVSFYINNKSINDYIDIPVIINKDYDINRKYNINSDKNIIKYIMYYKEDINNNTYYVPVTKYVNSDDKKINIIINELSSSCIENPNLKSIVDEKLVLINYEINDNEIILDFNNSIFFNNDMIVEEVVYPVFNTIFDNFNVKNVVIYQKGEEILKKSKKYLE